MVVVLRDLEVYLDGEGDRVGSGAAFENLDCSWVGYGSSSKVLDHLAGTASGFSE